MLPVLLALALLAAPAPRGTPSPAPPSPSPPPAQPGPVILFLIDNSASLPPLDPTERRVTALEKMFGFLQGHPYRLVLFGGKREISVDDASRYRNDGQWTDFYWAFVKAKQIAAEYPRGTELRLVLLTDAISDPDPADWKDVPQGWDVRSHSIRRTIELLGELKLPLYVVLVGEPPGEVAGRDAEQSPGFVLDMVSAANGRAATPLAQTLASFFADDGMLLRKFVYRVRPHEGLKQIEPIVRRIAAPPRARVEVRIFSYFLLPLILILVGLLGLLVRSFPGPGDLEILELQVDQPVHVAVDRLHRSPDAVWSAQGLSLVPDARTAAATFTLQGAGVDLSGHRLRHRRARPPRRGAAAARSRRAAGPRSRRPRTRARARRRSTRSTSTTPRAACDASEAERILARPQGERRRSGALDFVRAKARLALDDALRRRLLEPRVQVLTYGKDGTRRADRARRDAAPRPLRFPGARAPARRAQGRARRPLLRPRALAARAQDGAAGPVPAGVPLPPQRSADRELSVPGRVFAAGLDARELRLEVRFLQREPELVYQAATGGELLEAVERAVPELVVLGTRLVDETAASCCAALRASGASRGVSILALVRVDDPAGAEGELLAAGANAALRRPLDRFVLESWVGKLVDVPRRVRARVPVHVQVVGSRQQRPGRALLRAQPQPERARHAAREPGADRGGRPRPRAGPARAGGPPARARPRGARRPGGRLALRRLRGRVPVPAGGRPPGDRAHGAPRGDGRRRRGPRALGARRDPLDAAARGLDLRDHASPRARRRASWWRSAAPRATSWRPGHAPALHRGERRTGRSPRSRPPASSSAATADAVPRALGAAAGARRPRAGSTPASTRSRRRRSPTTRWWRSTTARATAAASGSPTRARRDPRLRCVRTPPRGLVSALQPRARARRAPRSSPAWTPTTSRTPSGSRCRLERLERDAARRRARLPRRACRPAARHASRGMRAYVDWPNALLDHDAIVRERFVESPLVHPSVALRAASLRAARRLSRLRRARGLRAVAARARRRAALREAAAGAAARGATRPAG